MKFNEFAGMGILALWLGISVLLSELYSPFKDLLADVFTHHWIGKGIVGVLLFIIVGYSYKKEKIFGKQVENVAWNLTIAAMTIIALFFILDYFI